MGWIDYNKKVYDVILHSWILVSFEKVQMSENIVQFIRKLMKNRTQICHYVKNIWQMLTSGDIYFRGQFVTIAVCDLRNSPGTDI